MPITRLTRLRRPFALLLLGLIISCSSIADDSFIIGVDTHLMNKSTTSAKALQLLEAAGVIRCAMTPTGQAPNPDEA